MAVTIRATISLNLLSQQPNPTPPDAAAFAQVWADLQQQFRNHGLKVGLRDTSFLTL